MLLVRPTRLSSHLAAGFQESGLEGRCCYCRDLQLPAWRSFNVVVEGIDRRDKGSCFCFLRRG